LLGVKFNRSMSGWQNCARLLRPIHHQDNAFRNCPKADRHSRLFVLEKRETPDRQTFCSRSNWLWLGWIMEITAIARRAAVRSRLRNSKKIPQSLSVASVVEL